MSPEQRIKIVALCLLSSMFCSVFATQASERESQSVEVTFYQLSKSEWSNSETAFKTLMSAEASTYCANNAATCGLDSGFVFTTNQVGVYSGPTEDSKSLKVKLYLDFPVVHVVSVNSSTQYVVNAAAVTTILANILADAEAALGHDIIYIGEEYYSIAPDALMNEILIPIAFLVLFIIIGIAIALHMWNKKKEAAEKKKKHISEKRKKNSRIRPVLTMENDNKQAINFWPRRSRKKKAPKQAASAPNGNIPTLSMKTNMMVYDSNPVPTKLVTNQEMAPQYEDQVLPRQNALPPLPNPVYEEDRLRQEEEKRERKERKRRKKEKRHQEREEGRMEAESEKSESVEVVGNNVIPVEDDLPAPLA